MNTDAGRSKRARRALVSAPADPARALLTLFVLSLIVSLGVGGILNLIFPISPRHAHEFIRSFGLLGPLGLIAIIALLIVFVPVPTIPFDIAAGVGFGVVEGSLYVLAGHILGALVAFSLARKFGRPLLRRLLPERALSNIEALAGQLGLRLLILMRLLPLFDFKVVSYAAGLADLTLRDYLLGTTIGIALPVFGMVAVGAELTEHPFRAALIVGSFGLVAGAGAAYFFFGRSAPSAGSRSTP